MSDGFSNVIAALQTQYDADMQAADTAGYQRGLATQVQPETPATPAGETPAPAPAVNVYTQEQYDAAVSAVKQSMQSAVDAANAKANAYKAKAALLQADYTKLATDLAQVQVDASIDPEASVAPTDGTDAAPTAG